jgi:rfaE bifunctional protein nucleotidyltransferase chain/domain
MSKVVLPTEVSHDGIIVLCQGCFDLLHIGHLRHLKTAKKFGDILVVAVTADEYVNKGPERPVFNHFLRMEQLAALEIVDFVVLSDSESAVDVIKKIRPSYFVKGAEYRDQPDITNKILIEKEAVEKVGGQLVFTDDIVYSSTALLNSHFEVLNPQSKDFLSSFDYSLDEVLGYLDRLGNLDILVIGETIYDRYTSVNVRNLAAKHHVLSSQFKSQETHIGGAAATARHLSQFCNNVDLLTCVPFTNEHLQELHDAVSGKLRIMRVPGLSPIIKERFLDDSGRQLFRVDYLKDDLYSSFDFSYDTAFTQRIKEEQYGLVIVNDFGHGMLTPGVISYLENMNTHFALNVQTNSANKGFNLATKYACADYLSIDLPEARLAVSNGHGDVHAVVNQLYKRMSLGTVSITHGKYGTHVFDTNNNISIPVFSSEAVDTTGAGDAYFAITSALAYLRVPLPVIGLIGNAVGALAIRIPGNKKSIDAIQLKKYIATLLK